MVVEIDKGVYWLVIFQRGEITYAELTACSREDAILVLNSELEAKYISLKEGLK